MACTICTNLSLQPINLVQGDDRPSIIGQFIDNNTGAPVNIADPTTSAFMKFREQGESTTLQDITLAKLDGGFTGRFRLDWPPGALDVDDGRYEGEFYINFAGEVQTVPRWVTFVVREQFA